MNGKKTYIVAGLIGLLTAVRVLGWIDESIYQTILALLGAGGLAALRAGVTKSGPSAPESYQQTAVLGRPGEFPGLDAGGPGVKGS